MKMFNRLSIKREKHFRGFRKRNSNGFQSIADVLNRTIENIDQLAQNNEEITGLPTGYAALDKMTAGLQKKS